ncbi:MAG TPA: hypothetical protein VGK67_41040 [Myxococcales bacterium]
MKRFLDGRTAIIDWIGLHGAMPGLRVESGAPVIFRPGDDEAGIRRVGWAEFFANVERSRLGLLVVDENPESFEHAFVNVERGKREAARPRHSVLEFLRALPATSAH